MDTKFPVNPAPLNKHLIGGVIVGAVVLAAGVLVTTNLLQPNAVAAPPTSSAPSEPTIAVTATGFQPKTVTIKKGTTVHWLNQTESPHQVASNPYPERTDLPDLYAAVPMSPGTTYDYTFEKAGTWGYNDPSNPTMNGTVIVR